MPKGTLYMHNFVGHKQIFFAIFVVRNGYTKPNMRGTTEHCANALKNQPPQELLKVHKSLVLFLTVCFCGCSLLRSPYFNENGLFRPNTN